MLPFTAVMICSEIVALAGGFTDAMLWPLSEVGQRDPTYSRVKRMKPAVHHELGNLMYIELRSPDASEDRVPMPELIVDVRRALDASRKP